MKSAPAIRAVTFDVGGTLLEPWPSVGHVYAAVAAWQGVAGADPAELNARFAVAWRQKRDFDYSRAAWFDLVRQSFGERARELPDSCFPAIYERFAGPDAWRVFDDARPTLDALASRGVRLGIISNWDERLVPLLGRLQLRKYFEVVVVSCDVGFTKPAREIFETAARQLGLSPAALMHVGDSEREDVEGARAAGWAARVIDRDRGAGAGRIGSLRELEFLARDG